MDLLTLLSNTISHIAWPITILIIVWWFRASLSELIRRIKSFEKEGDKYKVEIESAAKKVPESSPEKVPDDIKKLTYKAPVKAIDRSWEELSASASTAANLSMNSDLFTIGDALVRKNLLTETEVSALYDLNTLKDEALSGREFITDVSSSSYATVAYTLSDKLKDKKI